MDTSTFAETVAQSIKVSGPLDLVLAGRAVKAHLGKAQGYDEKARQHRISAGELLKAAKIQLKHGEWLPWLKKSKIAERSAQQAIQFLDNPEKHAAKIEADKKYNAEVRPNTHVHADLEPRVIHSQMTGEPSLVAVSDSRDGTVKAGDTYPMVATVIETEISAKETLLALLGDIDRWAGTWDSFTPKEKKAASHIKILNRLADARKTLARIYAEL